MKKRIIPFLIFFTFGFSNLYSQSGWTLLQTGIAQPCTDVFFYDSQTGWITSSDGNGWVFKSTNGGNNWTQGPQNFGMTANSVCFASPDYGIIVSGPHSGMNYPTWYSNNGGITWDPIAWTDYYGSDMRSVTLFNGQYWFCGTLTDGWYVTRSCIIEGFNVNLLYGHSANLNRIRSSPTEVWTVGDSGMVFRGTTLEPLGNPSVNLTGVSFPATNTGFVAGGSYVYKTTNSGMNWTRLHPLIPEGTYNDIFFTNNDTGWIACAGAMLYTTNGGVNWTTQWTGSGSGTEIQFINSQTGWVLWGNNVLKTTSGGNIPPPPPPPPVLASPPNGSTVNTTTPLLDWDSTPTANSYQVQISTDTVLRNIVLDTNGLINSNLTVREGILLPGALYYWKVRGFNSGGAGGWSPNWHFSVAPAPPPPVLVSPLNNSTGNPLNVTLAWDSSQGAASYRVQLALDSIFTNIVLNDSNITATTKVISGLTILTKYYWRVNGKGPTGVGLWSPIWNFKTMGTPTQVTLLQPLNNAVNVPTSYTFIWSKAYDQTFHIFVSNYWFERVTDTVSMANLLRDTSLTDTLKAVTGMSNNTSYYWRVKAKNLIGWGNFASWFRFTTVPAIPPAPVLIAPLNGAVGQSLTPTLDWSVIPSAANYRIQLSLDSIFSATVLDSVTVRDSLTVPANRLLNNTKYYWRVNAANAGGTGPWSAAWNFKTLLIGLENNTGKIPNEFNLYVNYPNPFNHSTLIKFDIPTETNVKVIVFDLIGREISVLINQQLQPGTYEAEFDGTNYPSGIYFYTLTTETFTQTRKMVLIK